MAEAIWVLERPSKVVPRCFDTLVSRIQGHRLLPTETIAIYARICIYIIRAWWFSRSGHLRAVQQNAILHLSITNVFLRVSSLTSTRWQQRVLAALYNTDINSIRSFAPLELLHITHDHCLNKVLLCRLIARRELLNNKILAVSSDFWSPRVEPCNKLVYKLMRDWTYNIWQYDDCLGFLITWKKSSYLLSCRLETIHRRYGNSTSCHLLYWLGLM